MISVTGLGYRCQRGCTPKPDRCKFQTSMLARSHWDLAFESLGGICSNTTKYTMKSSCRTEVADEAGARLASLAAPWRKIRMELRV